MLILLNGKRRIDAEQERSIRAFLEALTTEMPDVAFAARPQYYDVLQERGIARDLPVTAAEGNVAADLALSIGGDGTLLRSAGWLARRGIPVLGVNSGRLGYLAGVLLSDNPREVAQMIAHRRYRVSERAMLQVDVQGAPLSPSFYPYALNEVAVTKDDGASMIEVQAAVDGMPLATYQADGLIVSTPTGSTGYNLSVGGPIVAPHAPVMVLSPIAAHTLTMRPLVVDDASVVDLCVAVRGSSFRIALDGRMTALPKSATVSIRRAPMTLAIAYPPDATFAATLRHKLLWGVDAR